jgi:hypothetical protein
MTPTHKKVSGGHTQFGTLMLYNAGERPPAGDAHITSVFGLVSKIVRIN